MNFIHRIQPLGTTLHYSTISRWAAIFLVFLTCVGPLAGQDTLKDELRKIFEEKEYETKTFGPTKWLDHGAFYTTLEPSESPEDTKDIVRYETSTGKREVLVEGSSLLPDGATEPLAVEDYAWSGDRSKLLIFTNSKKVWRRNTRGDYWVLDVANRNLTKLGAKADSSLMFAKFSPDGNKVAYVLKNNLFVEDLRTGRILRLTHDRSNTIINGTSDWVYEEELGIRDGFRWSPDGNLIAFWNFDTSGIKEFSLINNTDTLYPKVTRIPYPKVGTPNSAVRIGVVNANGGPTQWMDIPGDERNSYLARMDWAEDSGTLAIQRLNRLQNTNEVLLANVETGSVTPIHRDESDTWVEVVDQMEWLHEAREFLWLSERDGWRHAYRVQRDGSGQSLITDFDADVIQTVGKDPSETWLYLIASPENATQRYLYRARLDGTKSPERVTPSDQPGTHSYDLSPDGNWAFHTYSRFEMPPQIELIQLPDHNSVRVLEDNKEVMEAASSLLSPPAEFFRVGIDDSINLDAWMIKPKDFDSKKKYPLLVFVYGEPAGQTVLDRWGGNRMLFHRALANTGFVVASFDNRGTPAPRGAPWRKVIYGTVGDLSSREQAAAVKALLGERTYLDGTRVAVWGWSGGGSNTLNCMFRFPDVFSTGVSVAPVPDQKLYDTIYQERYMGLPEENAEGYRVGSPINFAEGLRGRLLIIHGTGDDNVHYQGTERLVNRLIELGKPFDLMVYPNRTHSIREGQGTSLHIYSLIARYLREGM